MREDLFYISNNGKSNTSGILYWFSWNWSIFGIGIEFYKWEEDFEVRGMIGWFKFNFITFKKRR